MKWQFSHFRCTYLANIPCNVWILEDRQLEWQTMEWEERHKYMMMFIALAFSYKRYFPGRGRQMTCLKMVWTFTTSLRWLSWTSGKMRSYTSTWRRRLRGEHEHQQQQQPQTIMRASKTCEIAWLQYLKLELLLCGNALGKRRHCRSLGRVAPHQEQVSLDNIAGIIAAESRPVVKGNAIICHTILRFGFAVIYCQSVDNGTNTSVLLTIHFPLQSSLSLHTHARTHALISSAPLSI